MGGSTLAHGEKTFVVDRNNAIMEGVINPEIAQMCRSGLIVHADECCLVFTRKTCVSKQYDDSYYRICFLCRDPNAESFVEATCGIYEEHNEDGTNVCVNPHW